MSIERLTDRGVKLWEKIQREVEGSRRNAAETGLKMKIESNEEAKERGEENWGMRSGQEIVLSR